MKYFKNYLSALAVFALLFTSCSKEESSALDADAEYVELTFGALLNDLDNRSANKSQHFDDIPTCSDAAPDYARINFSYGGEDFEVVVDILSDAQGYFTAFSEDLKIPVNGGSTSVTLTGFLVFDSSDNIIWAAPVGNALANFVGQVLPMSFNVAAGTKPFIDVEVLCFDRRLVNEYGYVFFDIIPETIYPLCTFINYCNEAGRHWVASYSLDLFFGANANGIQLYDHEDAEAQVTVGTRNGEFFADPLCLVVPGPPANLANNQPYLFMIIYPNDWDANYGDIDNTPIAVQLSWNDVNALLNNDGTTNEFLHLIIGECEGALSGDGSITPPSCDLANANADCDNDGIPNKCDVDNPFYDTFDCDGDGFINSEDACPNIPGVAGGDGGDGCPADGGSEDCVNLAPACELDTEGALGENCYETTLEGENAEGWIKIESPGSLNLLGGLQGDEDFGDVTWTVSNGDLTLTVEGALADDTITAYAIEVRPSYSDGTMNSTCWESRCGNLGSQGTDEVTHEFDGYDYSYPFYLNASVVICGVPVGTP